ncbi:MAG: transposase [Streptosporangiaceae bacterium]
MAPARTGEPLMFAIDTTPHARPDAQYAGERTMVQVRGKGGDRWLPGWPYSMLVGIGWGSSSWADPIEARRIRPGEEHTDVTIGQITGLLTDLKATGKQQPGNPPPLVLLDAGNYATDLSWALADHDVQLLVRLRSTRVFYLDPPPRRPGQMGAPPLQGPSRLPPTPRTNRHTRRPAQTHPPRPGPPERLEEPPQIQATALPQEEGHRHRTQRVTTKA